MGVKTDTVCLLAGQTWFEDDYKDTDMLPQVIKTDMTVMMEAIKEYLRLHHGVVRAPLAYIIRRP